MNNSTAGNAVLAFQPQSDGSLLQVGTYPTGGTGTGGGLGNQAGLAFSDDQKLLFVVNAGSNDFSVFQITATGLTLASRTPSGGFRPISISERNGIAYVLNLTSRATPPGVDSISGFQVDSTGAVTPIANSTRPLSTTSSTTAAQVAISPDSKVVLVTERGTATIDAYPLDANGVAAAKPVLNPSSGAIPFGFQYLDATHVLVSEEGTDGASSYTVSQQGTLTPISRSIPTSQAAVCWLAITPNLQFAYTGNTSGASVSGFSIASDASLKLLVPTGLSASTAGGALDLTASSDSKYLYVVLNNGSLETFRINSDGSLTQVQTLTSLGAINGVISL
jgi:6-phosphogluconolactonase (cycloisomerase 2 family)